MRKLLLALVLATAALIAVPAAGAHPLGNFTVNHYAGIEVSGRTTYVHVVLDLAEIPTFQVGAQVRAPQFPQRLARSLELRVDGKPVALRALERKVSERPGAGGLKTLRLDVVYEAAGSGTAVTFADRSFANRIGWREITLTARDGARVERSSVPARSTSEKLRAYPDDLLSSPLDVRRAEGTLTLGPARGTPPAIEGTAAREHRGGGFEALIENGELSLGVILVSLLIAAFWGAAHALTPGHGKALVAGYLIGTRGTPRDAVLLGATVTVTHTAGVFALGLVTLALSQFIVPDQLYPWLTLVSGLLVVAVGAAVLRMRLRSGAWHGHSHGDHDRDHHQHHHHHERRHEHHAHDGHRHEHPVQRDPGAAETPTTKGILGIGIAAGLLPCPSALVVLLSAIALHRVGFGLALIVAFSVGLAATITAIGLVAVMAKRAFSRLSFEGRLVRALPAVSAVAILGVGVVLTARAIPDVL